MFGKLIFGVLVAATSFSISDSACVSNYVIRHKQTTLVVDIEGDQVTVEPFISSSNQKFKVDCAGTPGLFQIYPSYTPAKVLDVDKDNMRVVLASKDASYKTLTQIWHINHDGLFVNHYYPTLGLDVISDGTIVGGELLEITNITNPTVTQVWYLQEVV